MRIRPGCCGSRTGGVHRANALTDSDILRRIQGQLYILRAGEPQQIFPLSLSDLDWQTADRYLVTD